jgi:hypothetical protein
MEELMLSSVPQPDGTEKVTVVWSYYLTARGAKYYQKRSREEAIKEAESHKKWLFNLGKNIISSEIVDENQAIVLKYTEKMEKGV